MATARIRQPMVMDNAAEKRAGATAPAPREEEPDPEEERRRAPIEEHHFQRPTVSPVSGNVRTVARGG